MTWKADGLAEERPHDDVSLLPAEVRLDGLAVYPRFAAEDFERAFLRYCILVGAEEPFGDDQEGQLERDRLEFPKIALYGEQTGHFVMPEENALDFVVKATGHPRAWVASWNYRVALNDIAVDTAGDVRRFLRTSAGAYADALRYAARDRAGEIQI